MQTLGNKREKQMEIGFYSSPLVMPALAICIGACVILLKQNKNIGIILMLVGFILVTITQFSINYCVGLVALNIGLSEHSTLCNSITPHIKGVGFVLIALGIYKLAQAIKQNA
ncbi:MAG: hypothetical protein OEZ10_13060 [Gammaproteobacteria bacterium]|nr:hypothetical protein [Gammaproteobacteria bacterium]